MSSQAHVQSREAIEAVRAALVAFLDRVARELATLDVQMRRMLDWLEHDRPAYWKLQIRHAIDGVNEAQAALNHRLMFPIGDERPSCREERAALKRAQDHLAYCEQKAKRVKHWITVVRREMVDYQGRISQLVQLVEIDGPHAVAVLDNIMHHIDEYGAIRPSSRGKLPLPPAKTQADAGLSDPDEGKTEPAALDAGNADAPSGGSGG